MRNGQPIPEPRRGAPKYGFRELSAGSAIFIPAKSVKHADTIARAANAFANRNKRRFACRRLTERGQYGVRVWRVA